MKKRRLLPLLLAMVMLLNIPSAIASVDARDASTCLNSYTIMLEAEGDSLMYVEFIITGTTEMDKIGAYSLEIEQEVLPDTWFYYDTVYGDDDDPAFYTYDSIIHHGSYEFTAVPDFRYRVTLTAYAELGSDSDTGELTSNARLCT